MYIYKIEVKSGVSYIVKSKKTNMELLNLITCNEWLDYVLAAPSVMYIDTARVESNVVMIKSSEIVSLNYYVDNPTIN